MFCRNCGKGLIGTPEICANCGSQPVNATAFCRFCGNATTAQEVMCPKCGAAIRILAKSGEATNEGRGRFTTTKTVLKILAAVTFVAFYAFMSIPRQTLRPLQAAASDLVLASTGYTALPLSSISAFPPQIPMLSYSPTIYFLVNATQQLTISAIYKNTTTSNATGVGLSEDVTANSTYQSSNDKIATVTTGGLVHGVASGSATITVSYTAAPGSANISSAAQGKIPITIAITVPVWVTLGGRAGATEAPYRNQF